MSSDVWKLMCGGLRFVVFSFSVILFSQDAFAGELYGSRGGSNSYRSHRSVSGYGSRSGFGSTRSSAQSTLNPLSGSFGFSSGRRSTRNAGTISGNEYEQRHIYEMDKKARYENALKNWKEFGIAFWEDDAQGSLRHSDSKVERPRKLNAKPKVSLASITNDEPAKTSKAKSKESEIALLKPGKPSKGVQKKQESSFIQRLKKVLFGKKK